MPSTSSGGWQHGPRWGTAASSRRRATRSLRCGPAGLLDQQLAAGDHDRFTAGVLEVLAPDLAAVPYADGRVTPQRTPRDLTAVLSATRAAVDAQPEHPAWDVLDRAAVESALTRPDDAHAIWRLATVFLLEQEAA